MDACSPSDSWPGTSGCRRRPSASTTRRACWLSRNGTRPGIAATPHKPWSTWCGSGRWPRRAFHWRGSASSGSEPDDFRAALQQIDAELTDRIRRLRDTQRRLRKLAAGEVRLLPAEIDHHLAGLTDLGFTYRWIAMERDLWIVVYATHPEVADALFHDQAQALTDAGLLDLYLAYDRAHDLDPADPFLTELADRIVAASIDRYGTVLPGVSADSAIPQLLQTTVNASSPAWEQLDSLIRHRLSELGVAGLD